MQTPASFLETYRTVFARLSAPEIADLFAFPLHVAGDHGNGFVATVAASKEQWIAQLDKLLAGYRTLGVTRAEIRALDELELSPSLAQARVHWELFDGSGASVYDFHSVYTLGRGGGELRVIAIAHDELPRLGAALARAAKR